MWWSCLRVAALVSIGLTAEHFLGQDLTNRAERQRSAETALVGIDDWSHHYLVFSQPSDQQQALRRRLQKEPRFGQQGRMRAGAAIAKLQASVGPPVSPGSSAGSGSGQVSSRGTTGFWSDNLGIGAGGFPAKFRLNVAKANCGADFVAAGTGLPGATGQASIVAFNRLYPECGSAAPSVYWAYNTGGGILTSLVISPLGDQVAFVHSDPRGASLGILRWAPFTGGAVTSPLTLISNRITGIVPASAFRACTAPCMTTVAFGNGKNDSISSPFYDYANDLIYVGDDSGILHKFTNIFNGVTPAESSSRFPVTVDSGKILTSPVLDVLTGNIFVGDSGGFFSYVETAGPTPGAVVRSQNLGAGIADGPIIDSPAARAYVFLEKAAGDGGLNPAVYQFTTGFSNGNAGVEQALDNNGGGRAVYHGGFDNLYFASTAARPTGNLYVCGPTSGSKLALYRLPIVANVLDSRSSVAAAGSTPPACSPVAEIFNSGSEAGAATSVHGASGTMVNNTAVDNTPWAGVLGGSAGYFITLGSQLCTPNGNGGCAGQASQPAMR